VHFDDLARSLLNERGTEFAVEYVGMTMLLATGPFYM
jgi:hypothetical protein